MGGAGVGRWGEVVIGEAGKVAQVLVRSVVDRQARSGTEWYGRAG